MARTLEYPVGQEWEGKKLYQFLRGAVGCSVRLMNSLKRVPGGLQCNGQPVRTIDLLHQGDRIVLNIPEDARPAHSVCSVPVPVVYEDEDILVLNKPPFMTVHPSQKHPVDTLANAAAAHLEKEGRFAAFRPINRLDQDTTGLVLAGLNPFAACKLSGKVEKDYFCIACGQYRGKGTIDLPIRVCEENQLYREVGEGGQRALTHWEALKSDGEHTFLKIRLETGRTHQIRVHFAALGTPLLGDIMYGTPDERIARQALHCGALYFFHPVTGEAIELYSPLPDDMETLVSGMEEIR